MNLIFATNNQHKIDEIKPVLPPSINILTLKDAGINIDIPEPHDTLQQNAIEKARTIYDLTHTSCFSEDTGLEVEALNGEPGVLSARYAGDPKSDEKNIEKLLFNLQNLNNRKAQFRTIICLIFNNQQHFFEGICVGSIALGLQGIGGFGYDPVFLPVDSQKTFAQMTLSEKNKLSHRRKAVDKLVVFLNNIMTN
jgi:XTP/dITP diphosphohydrolase